MFVTHLIEKDFNAKLELQSVSHSLFQNAEEVVNINEKHEFQKILNEPPPAQTIISANPKQAYIMKTTNASNHMRSVLDNHKNPKTTSELIYTRKKTFKDEAKSINNIVSGELSQILDEVSLWP